MVSPPFVLRKVFQNKFGSVEVIIVYLHKQTKTNEMNTYYLEVLWADGKTEEIRIKADSYDVATNLHMWRRGYMKGMKYTILEINEH